MHAHSAWKRIAVRLFPAPGMHPPFSMVFVSLRRHSPHLHENCVYKHRSSCFSFHFCLTFSSRFGLWSVPFHWKSTVLGRWHFLSSSCFPSFLSCSVFVFGLQWAYPRMEGRNPLVRLRPIVRGLFARSLTPFFRFRNLISESCHGVGFFHPFHRYYFILFHFNIPCMVTVVFLQVVALLDI